MSWATGIDVLLTPPCIQLMMVLASFLADEIGFRVSFIPTQKNTLWYYVYSMYVHFIAKCPEGHCSMYVRYVPKRVRQPYEYFDDYSAHHSCHKSN